MSYSDEDFTDLESLFDFMGIEITGYDESRTRSLLTTVGHMAIGTLVNKIKKVPSHESEAWKMLKLAEEGKFLKLLMAFISDRGLTVKEDLPDDAKSEVKTLRELRLAKEVSFTMKTDSVQFFLVTPDDKISVVPAHHYIDVLQIENPGQVAMPLILEYNPRKPPGRFKKEMDTGEVRECINSYVEPQWKKYLNDDSVPAELPREIEILVSQIDDEMDRLYFWHWVYLSLTDIAKTFLIFNGKPGLGKSTFKEFLRALHGHRNTVTGKGSTFTKEFNTQLQDTTFIFFDEFKYSVDTQDTMKEVPNGEISIEGKGVDATRATPIYCSIIIANNDPRRNYVSFEDRKFSALKLRKLRLEQVMDKDLNKAKEMITLMKAKTDNPSKPGYDLKYIAQIGKWVLQNGYRPDLFPQGEHRGNKFWDLCHTSMFGWQKASIQVLTDLDTHSKSPAAMKAELEEGALKFSVVKGLAVKSKSLDIKSRDFPGDHSPAFAFLDAFRDLEGRKVFEVTLTGDSISGDFYIKMLEKPKIKTQEEIEQEVRDSIEEDPAEELPL